MLYPYYEALQKLTMNMNSGNFGLWYNKFIPVKDYITCKASGERGNDKEVVVFYHRQYNKFRKDMDRTLLEKKHCDQAAFCRCFSPKYEKVVFKAKLESPLITGIGESHPHEVSMVFDHNMGVPYIPASGIKGIVRFAHTLGLLTSSQLEIQVDEKGREYFDDEALWTNVPGIFGTQRNRGRAVFLDAYPEQIPDLHVDIMNPHYGQYYSDEANRTPPGDYLDPNPIKFLTVARGTVFVFRALVDKSRPDLIDMVKTAFTKALREEGVGAKTAVGYGFFGDLKEEESQSVLEFLRKEKEKQTKRAEEQAAQAEAERMVLLSEEERKIEEIRKLEKDTAKVAHLVKECLAGDFKPNVYEALKLKLEEIGEWKPAGGKQRKTKMRKRKAELEARIERLVTPGEQSTK